MPQGATWGALGRQVDDDDRDDDRDDDDEYDDDDDDDDDVRRGDEDEDDADGPTTRPTSGAGVDAEDDQPAVAGDRDHPTDREPGGPGSRPT